MNSSVKKIIPLGPLNRDFRHCRRRQTGFEDYGDPAHEFRSLQTCSYSEHENRAEDKTYQTQVFVKKYYIHRSSSDFEIYMVSDALESLGLVTALVQFHEFHFQPENNEKSARQVIST
jgi:hypothetical protein